MVITYRVDGRDFETLNDAVDYVAECFFGGDEVTSERSLCARGYEHTVFCEDDNDDSRSVTIFEVQD